MENIAYFCHPSHGHIDWGGVFELLQKLSQDNHVTVYSGKELEDRVRDAGIEFTNIGMQPIAPVGEDEELIEAVFGHLRNNFFNPDRIVEASKSAIRKINENGADLILSDPYCHVTQIVSSETDTSYLAFVSPVRNIDAKFRSRLKGIIDGFKERAREEFGEVGFHLNDFYPVTHQSPNENLNFSIPEFNVTNRADCIHLGGEKIEPAGIFSEDKKRVYYSSGTLFWTPEQQEIVLEATRQYPNVEFHITSGGGILEIPDRPNIQTYKFADETQLFPEMDVIITQGGMGTVGKAIRAGTPILNAPLFFGNHAQGREIQRYGNGIFLKGLKRQERFLITSLDKLLHNPSYRKRAQKLQGEFDQRWDYERLTTILESYSR